MAHSSLRREQIVDGIASRRYKLATLPVLVGNFEAIPSRTIMANLMVMAPPSNGIRFPVTPQHEVVIGRDGFCDIVLANKTVSRKHARVFFRGERCFIEDLGSSHGTFLNGDRVATPTILNDGDRINIYNTPIVFQANDEKDTSSFTMTATEAEALPPEPVPVKSKHSSNGIKPLFPGRLPSFVEISRRLGSSLDVEEIFPRVLDILFEIFPQSTLGEINLLDNDGHLAPVAIKHGRDDDSSIITRVPVGNDLARETLRLNQPIVKRSDPSASESVLEEESATVCIPMLGPSQTKLGTILLEAEGSAHHFSDDDVELIALVGVVAGQAVEYAHAHKRLLVLDQTQRQLANARQIQLRMLPRERPNVSGYRFEAHYSAAQVVGGDYFFWDVLPENRVAFGVADACGKGMTGALMIAQFATQVRQVIATARTLKSALSSINRFVFQLGEGFITFCLCLLDANQHTMTLVNAGHPNPLCRRRKSSTVEDLLTIKKSLPLGIDPETEFHPFAISVEPGDEIFVWSDGITEAMAPDQSLFGETRLKRLIEAPQKNLKARLDVIITHINAFRASRPPSDDTCLLAVTREET